jgi:hypothetical protein
MADIAAPLIAASAAIAVAILGSISSYYLSRRQARRDLDAKLQVAAREAEYELAQARRSYELDAMKQFRAATGPAKSQIIEAVHDLSDRLRGLLSRDPAHPWSETSGNTEYKRTLVWRLARPVIWLKLLRRELSFLDHTLGELLAEELKFLRACHLLELSYYGGRLFDGVERPAAAGRKGYVTRECLAELAEACSVSDKEHKVCIDYSQFKQNVRVPDEVSDLVSDLEPGNPDCDLQVARLVAVYAASNALLAEFALPFRKFEPVEASVERVALVTEARRPAIRANLVRLLEAASDLPS